MTRLESERLVLRDFVADDGAAVHDYASDPEVTRFTTWGPNTFETTREFLATVLARPAGGDEFGLAITLRDGGRLIGSVGIGIWSDEHRRGELGYVLNRAYWSQGFATEATLRLARFGFEELDLHRIEATCHPDNGASARVLEKAGFQFEGRLRDHMQARGQWRDSLLYATIRAT
ncbi:MAG TPA: GNAT family N-acetyltransferase [Jatrophihabitantaceae bacterium]|nr:GNAT family N-acetyltransferase [Jatrophihabitantaceae bacterium]